MIDGILYFEDRESGNSSMCAECFWVESEVGVTQPGRLFQGTEYNSDCQDHSDDRTRMARLAACMSFVRLLSPLH